MANVTPQAQSWQTYPPQIWGTKSPGSVNPACLRTFGLAFSWTEHFLEGNHCFRLNFFVGEHDYIKKIHVRVSVIRVNYILSRFDFEHVTALLSAGICWLRPMSRPGCDNVAARSWPSRISCNMHRSVLILSTMYMVVFTSLSRLRKCCGRVAPHVAAQLR